MSLLLKQNTYLKKNKKLARLVFSIFYLFIVLGNFKTIRSSAASTHSKNQCRNYFIQADILESLTPAELKSLKTAAAAVVSLQTQPHADVSSAKEDLNLQVLNLARKKGYHGKTFKHFFLFFNRLVQEVNERNEVHSETEAFSQNKQRLREQQQDDVHRVKDLQLEKKKIALIQKYNRGIDFEKFGINLNLALERSVTRNEYNSRKIEVEDIALLLEMGADVNKLNENLQSPLDIACEGGFLPAVQILIQAGAKIAASALVQASFSAHLDVVEYLISLGANKDLATDDGTTPLMAASRIRGNSKIVNYFLQLGANVNAVDNLGKSALTYASQNADVESVRLLLQFGADMDVRDIRSTAESPLLYAIRGLLVSGVGKPAYDLKQVKVVSMLLDAGADIERKDNSGKTPLALAVYESRAKVVELLLQRKADTRAFVTYSTGQLHNLMHAACFTGDTDIVRLLVAAGLDINSKDIQHATPLMTAVKSKEKEIIEFLLSLGVDLDAQETDGSTALTLASSAGAADIVRLLIAAGANPRLKVQKRYTALSLAESGGHQEVVELLKTYLKETKPPTLLERIRSRWQNRGVR